MCLSLNHQRQDIFEFAYSFFSYELELMKSYLLSIRFSDKLDLCTQVFYFHLSKTMQVFGLNVCLKFEFLI